jgi:predicted nucleic acid-binding protein
MLHVLCRIFSQSREIEVYLSLLLNLGMSVLRTGGETLSAAVKLVKENGLSGYDAIYGANAKLVGGIWLTADREAHQKIAALNISGCLV